MKPKHILLIVLLVVLWVIALFQSDLSSTSSFSSKMNGSRAFLLALKQLGYNAKPWLFPFSELNKNEPGSALIVVSPESFGSSKNLLKWVEAGNRLIVLSASKLIDLEFLKELNVEVKDKSLSDLFTPAKDGEIIPSCPAEVSAVCNNVNLISASTASFTSSGNFQAIGISKQEGHTTVSRIKRGKGDVWFFSGDAPIKNRNIDLYDNFRFLFQLVSDYNTIWFDEFHHGYRAPVNFENKNQYYGVWLLGGLLTALLVIFSVSRAIRFGQLDPEPEQPLPSSRELVMAMGILFQDHHAHETLRYYLKEWKNRAALKFKLSKNLPYDSFVKLLSSKLNAANQAQLYDALRILRTKEKSVSPLEQERSVIFLEQILITQGET